nr:hypothetical protein [Kibdelosporangium sp. MJ126-NF4]CEL13512.1 hypothetical protein [Kibdelosporangium sp. MJ126-NF4]CTQ99197.1 hypothetical protein [Kibdelosporangium sp. MJ126-NF4]
MNETFTNPPNAQRHEPTNATPPAREKIRSPHAIPFQAVSSLVRQWSDARARVFDAQHSATTDLDCDDLFAELAYGARIARDATAGRWCAVADLLRAGAVQSWTQIGIAIDMTDAQAREGFHAWITGQVNLQRRTSTIGLTDTQATELTTLAQAVPL